MNGACYFSLGGGTPSCLQISRTRLGLISRCLGTRDLRLLAALNTVVCFAPSRSKPHPCCRRCFRRLCRFMDRSSFTEDFQGELFLIHSLFVLCPRIWSRQRLAPCEDEFHQPLQRISNHPASCSQGSTLTYCPGEI